MAHWLETMLNSAEEAQQGDRKGVALTTESRLTGVV